MAETVTDKKRRLRKERNRRRKLRSNLLNRAEQHARRIRVLNRAIARLERDPVPASVGGWHAKAIRNQTSTGIGAFMAVPAKGVLHTTEGSSLPTYSGSQPHFTHDFKRGLLYQHIPVTSGALALKNLSGGVETNRAHAIQIELVGFAGESHTWSDAHYARIAETMRWCEKHAGVAKQCSVTFRADADHKVSGWLQYRGWLGHQHVPENDHWDPGRFQIDKVL